MKQAVIKTWQSFKGSIPMIIGILMLVNLINPLFKNYYVKVFTGNYFLDPLIGGLAGSISFGIPITSYIAGGELLNGGVSLLAVTAFIMAWTTVGFIWIPLEGQYLGRKFALSRNLVNFVFTFIIAIITILTLKLL
jgi:hypothetical protein